MAKRKTEAEAVPTRAEVFDAGRARLAEVYSYLSVAAADPSLPITAADKATFRRLRRRVSDVLEAFNERGRIQE